MILTDEAIWQAYKLLSELPDIQEGFDKATICRIHSRLMKTCQFSDLRYIAAGKTRTETRKTVVVAGTYKIECCPFPEVDEELEYIFKMAKVGLPIVSVFSGIYCGTLF